MRTRCGLSHRLRRSDRFVPASKGSLTSANGSSRLGDSNPGPTHYERVQCEMVADDRSHLGLDAASLSTAGNGRCREFGGTPGAQGRSAWEMPPPYRPLALIQVVE